MNIAEILKDAPKGTKLYSLICGECELVCVERVDSEDKICVGSITRNTGYWFNHNGTVDRVNEGECILFPSKDNRDWSTFKAMPKFKRGDFVVSNLDTIAILNGESSVSGNNWVICALNKYGAFETELIIKIKRYATEEEKQELLKAIDENEYVWDEEKLKLRNKEHEFKPFDKVLVRGAINDIWECGLFSHKDETGYRVNSLFYKYCIPYEGNEHLLGTTNNPE